MTSLEQSRVVTAAPASVEKLPSDDTSLKVSSELAPLRGLPTPARRRNAANVAALPLSVTAPTSGAEDEVGAQESESAGAEVGAQSSDAVVNPPQSRSAACTPERRREIINSFRPKTAPPERANAKSYMSVEERRKKMAERRQKFHLLKEQLGSVEPLVELAATLDDQVFELTESTSVNLPISWCFGNVSTETIMPLGSSEVRALTEVPVVAEVRDMDTIASYTPLGCGKLDSYHVVVETKAQERKKRRSIGMFDITTAITKPLFSPRFLEDRMGVVCKIDVHEGCIRAVMVLPIPSRDDVQQVLATDGAKVALVGAASGAVLAGAAGGSAGGILGTSLGALCGLPAAPFTLGISLIVGASVGGSTGVCVGVAAGGSAGSIGGGALGYLGFCCGKGCWRFFWERPPSGN